MILPQQLQANRRIFLTKVLLRDAFRCLNLLARMKEDLTSAQWHASFSGMDAATCRTLRRTMEAKMSSGRLWSVEALSMDVKGITVRYREPTSFGAVRRLLDRSISPAWKGWAHPVPASRGVGGDLRAGTYQ